MNQTQMGTPLIRRGRRTRRGRAGANADRADRPQPLLPVPDRHRPATPARALLRHALPDRAAWVATRGDTIVGHAMWAVGSRRRSDRRTRGDRSANPISGAASASGCCRSAAADAIAAGATRFLFVVSPANDRTLRMIRRRWPEATVERDGTLMNFVVAARQRTSRKKARMSSTSRSGASSAAKCPPRSNSDQWTMRCRRSSTRRIAGSVGNTATPVGTPDGSTVAGRDPILVVQVGR